MGSRSLRAAAACFALFIKVRAVQIQLDFIGTEEDRVIGARREKPDGRIGLSSIDLKTERQLAVSFIYSCLRCGVGGFERRGPSLRVQSANLRSRAKQTDHE